MAGRGTIGAGIAVAGALTAGLTAATTAPERTVSWPLQAPTVASPGVVAAATPEAAEAGAAMLAAGGNAMDAAAAAAWAVSVTDPGHAGVGGVALVLIAWPDGHAVTVDAPVVRPSDLAMSDLDERHRQGRAYGWTVAGVPTMAPVVVHAQRAYGRLDHATTLAPALRLAQAGAPVHRTGASLLGQVLWKLRDHPRSARLLLGPGLEPWTAGEVVRHPEMLPALSSIASAEDPVAATDRLTRQVAEEIGRYSGSTHPSGVAVRERPPARGVVDDLEVLSAGRPHGGGILIEALGILEELRPGWEELGAVDRAHLKIEAVRIALGDRALRFTGRTAGRDPQLDPRLWRRRARQIRSDRPLRDVELWPSGPDQSAGRGGTSHISAADASGMVVALTMSIGGDYGAKVVSPTLGATLNDFLAATPAGDDGEERDGWVVASAMAPTVVRRGRAPIAVLGGAGSDRITGSLVEVFTGIFNEGLDPAGAMVAPRVIWCGPADRRTAGEAPTARREALAEALAARGFDPLFVLEFPARPTDLAFFGGVQAVVRIRGPSWTAVADPRRDGGVSAGSHDRSQQPPSPDH